VLGGSSERARKLGGRQRRQVTHESRDAVGRPSVAGEAGALGQCSVQPSAVLE